MVRVWLREVLLPVATFPKLWLAGLAASWPGVTAIAERGTVNVPFDASDVIVRLPVAFPADAEEKVTFRLVLCPAASVVGRLKPEALNPDPETFMAEMVTLVVPELVRMSGRVCEFPIRTFPKLILVGLAVSCPMLTPVPEADTVAVETSEL